MQAICTDKINYFFCIHTSRFGFTVAISKSNHMRMDKSSLILIRAYVLLVGLNSIKFSTGIRRLYFLICIFSNLINMLTTFFFIRECI